MALLDRVVDGATIVKLKGQSYLVLPRRPPRQARREMTVRSLCPATQTGSPLTRQVARSKPRSTDECQVWPLRTQLIGRRGSEDNQLNLFDLTPETSFILSGFRIETPFAAKCVLPHVARFDGEIVVFLRPNLATPHGSLVM